MRHLFVIPVALLFLLPAATAEESTEKPTEIRRGLPWHQHTREERRRMYLDRLVEGIVTDGSPNAKFLRTYIDYYELKRVSDPNHFVFDVTGELTNGRISLEGLIEFPQLRDGLIQFLEHMEIGALEDNIGLLPTEDLGPKIMGIVSDASVYFRDKPTEHSEPITQGILGDTLFLLAEVDNWYLCHSAFGYVGYCPTESVVPLTKEEHTAYVSKPKLRFTKRYESTDVVIPLGSCLPGSLVKFNGAILVTMPDGRAIGLPGARSFVKRIGPQRNARAKKVLNAAQEFLGTDYKWGGKTRDGADCSGFIQTVFRANGIALPRDAYQQLLVGELVATQWNRDDLQPGDALFFVGRTGRISHVALSMGGDKYINASGGAVQIESLDPDDPDYNEKHAERFVFAKRVLLD